MRDYHNGKTNLATNIGDALTKLVIVGLLCFTVSFQLSGAEIKSVDVKNDTHLIDDTCIDEIPDDITNSSLESQNLSRLFTGVNRAIILSKTAHLTSNGPDFTRVTYHVPDEGKSKENMDDVINNHSVNRDTRILIDNPANQNGVAHFSVTNQNATNKSRSLSDFDLSSFFGEATINSANLILKSLGPVIPLPAFLLDAYRMTSSRPAGTKSTFGALSIMLPFALEQYYDEFTTLVYDGTNGTTDWSSSPWVEVGDGTLDSLTGAIAVRNSTRAFGGTGNTLKTSLGHGNSAPGVYVYREVDLSTATSATLSFYFTHTLAGADDISLEISNNGGSSWTVLKNYTSSDPDPSNESFNISAYLASNTQIRFVLNTIGGGGDIWTDNVKVEYLTGGDGPFTISSRVNSSSDDAEEQVTGGSVDLISSDLELISDSGTDQIVGMRFNNITVPPGATITNAYIEFEVDELDSVPTDLTIIGHDTINSDTFSGTAFDISKRAQTTSTVSWNSIPFWGIESEKKQTPEIRTIIQEIIDLGGWTSGNSLSIFIEGSGERTAEAYEGEAANAPILSITYTTGDNPDLVVTTANDVLDGDTTSIYALIGNKGADNHISLREAIIAANNSPNTSVPDTIRFSIGTGAQTIMVNGIGGRYPNGTGLDYIYDPVVIDATTQPGYAGTPLITLDGTNATGTTAGLVLRTNNSTIRGFIVTNFIDEGLEIDGTVTYGNYNILENNWVGIDAAGNAAGNTDNGILVTSNSDYNIVRNNVSSSNGNNGILIRNTGSDNNWVYGNIVGMTADSLNIRANAEHGIFLSGDAANNIIGTNGDGSGDEIEGNVVSGNTKNGIAILTTSGVAGLNPVLGNRIYNNGRLGIDLDTTGVTPNDAGDIDAGPNNFLNFVEMNQMYSTAGDLDYDFDADLPAGDYRVDFFNNPSGVDPSGNGEGEIFIGAVQINHGGTGSENFTGTFTPQSSVNGGDDLTAVTIECVDGTCSSFTSSSEFSAPQVVYTDEICNNSIDDDGDGLTDCADPDCDPAVSLVLPDTEECESSTVLALSGGSPGGGTYSGTGVSGSNFNASVAGPGVHTITYSYTDSNGCSNSATDDITVHALPAVSLTLPDTEECENSTILALSGGSPVGGTYSGTGVSGTNFNASVAGVGNHTITYTYTDGNGCINTATDDITVHALPAVSLTLPDTDECVNSTTLALSGGSPVGGTYSGTGVSGTNFNASTAGVGVHTITYTYTDGNGCVNTATDDITVHALPVVSLTLSDTEECVSSTTLTLSGGAPSGGSYSGTGVSGTNFDASTAGVGNHTITYTYTDGNGCVNTATDDITVHALPVVSLTLGDTEECENSTTLSLSGGSPGGGTYSGTGVSGTNFDASTAGVGVHTITYTYTDGNGCVNTATDDITVHALPVVSLTLSDTEECVSSTTLTLSGGAPSGGSYSGTGVSGTNFDASTAGVGNHTITYTYTDGNGCVNTATDDITVHALPVVSLTLSDTEECVSSTTLILSGGAPSGGSYSGTGVSGTNFDASTAGVGNHTITYTYTDGNGCVNTATDDITVHALPAVSLTLPDTDECVNSTTLALSGGSPVGGTYSGTGVSGTNFNASTAGVGVHTITYTYTDGNGCVNTATDDITVHALPAVSLTLGDTEECVSSTTLILSGGAPSGGSYSGTGVSGTNFDASTAGVGNHTITYTYTDGNGCVNTATDDITVHALPVVSLTLSDTEECENSTTLFLSGGSPGGGTYSGTGVSGTNFDASIAGVGNHTITYTYTDGNGCVNTDTDDITVHALPSASLTLSDTEECVSSTTLTLSGGSPAGGIYSGAGVSGTNFNASTAGVGVHTITYTYTDGNGCVDTATDDITVHPSPTATAGSNSPACEGADLYLTETGGDAVSWSWTGPNSFSSSDQNPTISPSSSTDAGTYKVIITDSNGCIDSSSVSVTIVAPPNVVANSNSPICEGDTLRLYETGGDGTAWSWVGPNSFSSTDQNPVIPNATSVEAGLYFVTVSGTAGCLSAVGTNVLVDSLPVVTLNITDSLACENETTLILSGGSPSGGTFSGTGVSGTNFNASIAGVGMHIITYTYTDGNGCAASAIDSIDVLALPAVGLTLGDDQECVSSTIMTLSGGSPGGGTYSGTGVSGGNFNASAAGLGVHTITYTYTDLNGCVASATDDITVINDPAVNLTLPDDTECITETALALSGGSPSGGTFSGVGVSGSNFDASVAGVGVHTITYTYTDGGTGCSNSATDNITVFALPAVSLNLPDKEDCVLNNTLALSGGLPSGGTFSGAGVSASNFDASVAGLGSHPITYTYTDANGCTNAATDTIEVVSAPVATLTLGLDEDCVANNTLVLTGGSPTGGTYSGDGVSGTNFNAALAGPGVHTITYSYTDANGCNDATTDDITVYALPIYDSVTPTNPTTCAGTDGTITITASGGTGSFEYRLNSGTWQSSNTFTGLSAGFHDVYIRNDNDFCEVAYASNSVVLSDPPDPLAEINLPADGCVNAPSNFTATDAGGSATYSWNFGPGATPSTATGIGPHVVSFNSSGTKSIALTVTLAGCVSIDIENYTVNDLPSVGLTLPDDEECVSSATLGLSGGSPSGGTYSGTGVSGTNFDASVAGVGTHTITYSYTDGNGCTNSATDDIDVLALPSVSLTLGTDEACISSSSLTLTGGSPGGGTYSGTGVSGTNFDASTAGAGAHVITYSYTDANGCENSATDIINVFDFPNYDNVATSDPTTCGGSNGSITITLSSGSGSYEYQLNSGSWQSSNTFNSLSAGSYNITVRNDNGLCEIAYSSNPVVLSDPPAITVTTNVTSNHTGEDISCVGEADGSASASGSGGTAPYSYLWSNGQTGPNLVDVVAGTYSVTATDDNGCQAIGSVTLNDPPPLGATATFTNVTCYGGSDGAIDVTATGGVGAYTYAWNDLDPEAYWPMDGTTDDISGNEHHATGLTGTEAYSTDAVDGDFSFDFDGNTGIRYDDGSFMDTLITYRTLLMWIKPDAFNEKYMLYDEGGIIAGIALGLDNGELVASVRNSFQQRTSFPMTVPDDGQWHQVGFIYENGMLTLTVDGVLGTSTNTGFTTINLTPFLNGSSGLGHSFGSNAFGFSSYDDYEGLMDNVEFYNSALQSTQISDINDDDGDRTGLPAGDYKVYVYDLNGCIDSVSLTLTQPDSLALTADITDVLCNGGSTGEINLTIAGGISPYTQLWSTGATTEDINSLSIGTYSITVTDDNGCTVIDSFTINEPAALTATAAVTSNYNSYDVSCAGATDGSATVTPIGGMTPYSYNWSNGQSSTNLVNVGAGTYGVTVTDDNGCTTTSSVTLTDPPQITVTTSVTSSYNGEDISCVGASDGAANALASNGVGSYAYIWSNGQTGPNLTNVTAGTYTVTATDDNGCTAVESVTLQDPSPIVVSTSVTSNYNGADVSCPGSTDGSANASASGGSGTYTYEWSNGQNGSNLTGVGAGTYTVTTTDAFGCTGVETITLVNPADLSVSINITSDYNGYDISCKDGTDGTALAIGTGGTGAPTYLWSNGQNTANLSNVGAGTYTVTMTDINGCTATSDITLTAPPELTFTASSAAPSDCGVDDGIILITATGGIGTYEYSINGSTWQSSNSFTGLTPGTYFTYVRNDLGTCQQGPTAVTVNIPEAPTIDNITIINPTTGSSNDGGVLVNASGNGLSIEYSIDGATWQSSNLFTGLDEGSYTARIRYVGFNCISSSPITLVAGGGIVGIGGGENYCSDDISGVNFVETYYIPFPEDQVFTSLTSIYPGNATCGSGTDVSDPMISYNSIGIVENGTIIYFDHWEDGYEINAGFPIQATSEIWGDGNTSNGVAPGYPADLLFAGDILVLQDNVVSTTRAAVIDYDGGDKISSRGNLAFTRLIWPTGPGTFFAGAIEVYPSIVWGSTFEIPVGENADVNDMFDYVGAVVMAANDGTVLNIDIDGNGSTDITTTINEGQSYLIDGSLNFGATISASNQIQVHLVTGSYCQTYETRWYTLKSTDKWSDSYFNPVATQNGSGDNNDPTYVHLYNPNSTSITVKWETTGGSQADINIAAGGVAWREIPNNTGSHFYTTNNADFYAIATVDSEDAELVHDWGFAILPESQLTGQITMVGFAPGETPGASSGSNTSPVWITPGYPSGSPSSGSITICVDYNGDGGSLTDLNGTPYDASLVLNELGMAKLYDPDGDQTGMRIWVCDGSDAIIAGAYGQDPTASDGSGSSNELDLGTGLPNGIPFAASKCADLSKDYNSNGLYDECDEVIYTLEIRNTGSLPLSTGSLTILDTLPSEVTYIENTSRTIINGSVNSLPDDGSPSSAFPFDEGGFIFNSVVMPGDSIIFRFEATINDIPGAQFITNTATVTSGQQYLNPEVSFPAQEPTGPILTGVPANETVECDAVPDPPTIGSDIYVTNNCEDVDVISQSGWSLLYTDSEELVSESAPATNAFDGNNNTYWHTQYNGSSPPHPHEIQIDLGATYYVAGFRYLPRQSGTNGMIENFEFFVSADGVDWGSAVTTGTWSLGLAEEEELFNLKRGRYIRLVALSEVNGNPWTSIAELNILECVNFVPNTIDFSESSTQTSNGTTTDDCYVLTRTWTATDHCGQVSVNSQDITVEDTTDPILVNVPEDITVNNSTIPLAPDLSCTGVSNVALGKPATQSSTTGANIAANAVDGNFTNSSRSETNSEVQPWWQVDLLDVNPIQEIEIWNRTDCCTARLSNYYVLVSDRSFASTDLATTLLDPNVTSFFQTAPAGTPTTITIDTTARYIRVQLQGTDILNLVEVVVTPQCIFATDNCDPDVTITYSEVNVPTGCTFDITRTWTATDNCGNTSSRTQTITVASVLQIDAMKTSNYNGRDISCFSGTDGTATGIITGGVAPYTINWSNGQSGANATNLGAGTYIVNVTDDNGCSAQDSVTLVAPPDIVLTSNKTSNYKGADVSCFGASDGTAFANATGGTGAKTYLWSNGQTTQNASGLSAGTYSVTATDANGCFKTSSVTLQNPQQLTVSASVTSDYNGEDISCAGGSDGSAAASASGGTGDITYYWSNSKNTPSINGLTAGTYRVTATDGNGCTAVDSVTLQDPPPIIFTNNVVDPSLCEAGDASITVTASGGTGSYQYRIGTTGSWQSSSTFTGMTEGSYDVYVRNDDSSCPTGPVTSIITDPVPQSCPITPAMDTLIYCSTDFSIPFSVDPSPDASGYTWTVPAGMALIFGQGTDSIVVDMNNIAPGFYNICVVTNSNCGDSPPCCTVVEIITCAEICDNGFDDDGDGLTDCDDPDCGLLSVNATIGSCIDDPLMDRATLDVELSWSAAYSEDFINVSIFRKTEIIDIEAVSSPYTVSFNVPADGAVGDSVIATWESGNTCTDFDLYNTPVPCSNDTIACDILYLQSFHNPVDQDAWDKGWLEYLDAVNGSASITTVVTKDDVTGLGLYDVSDTSLVYPVNFEDYGIIIISASTENYFSTDLIDTLRNMSTSILNSNYTINTQLGLTVSAGIDNQDFLYTDDSNTEVIYNFNTWAPFAIPSMTRSDLVTGGYDYLWTTVGSETSENNAAYFEYDRNVNLPVAGTNHGKRVYLGYHLNGVYGDPANGGSLPAPVSGYFDPTRHLTGVGKIYFDQAIISASDCAQLCLTAITNPHILYNRPKGD